jgi:DNA-binding CsgD family transcriptional regulator
MTPAPRQAGRTAGGSLPRRAVRAGLPPDASRLQDFLFPLHAATEVGALWAATRALLRAAFAPCVRVTLFLGHFGMREARLVLTDPPIPRTAEWFRERGLINPFTPYIRAHRRVTYYRFSDILGSPAKFRATEFYRRFAEPEGWDKGLSGLFWRGQEVKAMFSIYRAPTEPEFDARDIERLHYLRPHVETAVDRVAQLHAERLHRRVLEEFNRHIPIGLLLLDWEFAPVFSNVEAIKECAVWRLGAGVARGLVSRERFALPEPIRAVCAAMRDQIMQANAKDRPRFAHGLERVAHPMLPGRVAAVSAIHAEPGLLALPGFLVILEDRSAEVAGGPARPTAERRRLLWSLTPSERELALLICEGASNAEVARRLKKSLLTVKKQATAIYAKLNVPGRARLIALLR